MSLRPCTVSQRGAVAKRLWIIAAALLLLSAGAQAASGPPVATTVYPPEARPYGKTLAEWSGLWWAWAFSIPAGVNPILDPTGANCAEGQSGHVWFLAGSFSDAPLTRSCTVPGGKAIFLPMINIECSTVEPPPFYGGNEAELVACATSFIGFSDAVTCTVDGVDVSNAIRYRFQSPVTPFTTSVDNILGLPAGTNGLLVSDGYWIMLPPLSVGQHEVHFTALLGGGPFAGFAQDVTYQITVKSKGRGPVVSSDPGNGEPALWGAVKSIYR
jgi:hypothetical protein